MIAVPNEVKPMADLHLPDSSSIAQTHFRYRPAAHEKSEKSYPKVFAIDRASLFHLDLRSFAVRDSILRLRQLELDASLPANSDRHDIITVQKHLAFFQAGPGNNEMIREELYKWPSHKAEIPAKYRM